MPTETANYIKWMNKHLKDKCREVNNPELTATYTKANELLAKFEGVVIESEFTYIPCWICSRHIPMPRLLMKNHKDPKEVGSYPTHILISATNFTLRNLCTG